MTDISAKGLEAAARAICNSAEADNYDALHERSVVKALYRQQAQAAIRAYLEATPPEAVNDEKERWQAWAQKRLAIQSKHWLRAAKSALAGDTRELRNRVELAEADPAEVVLSPARLATKGGE